MLGHLIAWFHRLVATFSSSRHRAAKAIRKGHSDPDNLRELLIWTTSVDTCPMVEAYFAKNYHDRDLLRSLLEIAQEGSDSGDAPWAAANVIADFPPGMLIPHRDALEELSRHEWMYISDPAKKAIDKIVGEAALRGINVEQMIMSPHDLPDRRFTDSARRVIRHIADRALDRGMVAGELTEATAGMLAVLSILRWERKVARAVLEQLEADLDRLARDIDEAIRTEGLLARNPDGPQFSPSTSGERHLEVDIATPLQPLVEQAERESQLIGHDWVGTEHVLLAAVRLACPRFRDVLDRHGVTRERVQKSIFDLLGPPPEAGPLPESSTG